MEYSTYSYPNNLESGSGEQKLTLLEKRLLSHSKNRGIRRKYKGVSISDLKDKESGKDIYVLGSGSSMDYLDPSFLKGKVCISVNEVCFKYPSKYLLRMHQDCVGEDLQKMKHTFCHLVLSEYNCGLLNNLNHYDEKFYYFRTKKNTGKDIDLDCLDKPDMLVAGGTTFTSAIHFAYFLGAKNIIICGHDCGTIDGNINYSGYYNDEWVKKQEKVMEKGDMSLWQRQTLKLVDALRERGVNVVSLNPFINLGLEGHKYKKGE